jgi:hypothetical protein
VQLTISSLEPPEEIGNSLSLHSVLMVSQPAVSALTKLGCWLKVNARKIVNSSIFKLSGSDFVFLALALDVLSDFKSMV